MWAVQWFTFERFRTQLWLLSLPWLRLEVSIKSWSRRELLKSRTRSTKWIRLRNRGFQWLMLMIFSSLGILEPAAARIIEAALCWNIHVVEDHQKSSERVTCKYSKRSTNCCSIQNSSERVTFKYWRLTYIQVHTREGTSSIQKVISDIRLSWEFTNLGFSQSTPSIRALDRVAKPSVLNKILWISLIFGTSFKAEARFDASSLCHASD